MLREERAVSQALGTLLMRNVADQEGRRFLKKGTILTEEHLARGGARTRQPRRERPRARPVGGHRGPPLVGDALAVARGIPRQ